MVDFKLQYALLDNIVLKVEAMSSDDSAELINKIQYVFENDLVDVGNALLRGRIPDNWIDAGFDAESFEEFCRKSIHPDDISYIIWSDFSVDITETSCLRKNFDYYWYPEADDIFIASKSLSSLIFVRHDGKIFYRLNRENARTKRKEETEM